MNALITGTFEAEQQAIGAVHKLLRACVPANRVRAIWRGSRRRIAAHQSEGGAPPCEPGSILVAIKATNNVCEALAYRVLRDHGAQQIERKDAERRAEPRFQDRRAMPRRFGETT